MKKVLFFVTCFIAAALALSTTGAVFAAATPGSLGATTINPADPCRDSKGNEICTHWFAGDGRINSYEAQQTATGYCKADHSLDVYSVINSVGTFLYNVPGGQIAAALAIANSQGNVLIQEQMGRQLWALPGGQLQLHDASSGYDFRFSGQICGAVPATTFSPTNTVSVVTTAPVAPVTDTSTTISLVTGPAKLKGTTYTLSRLNLRNQPNTSSERIVVIPVQTALTILGRDASFGWLRVSYNTQEGWVYAYYTDLRNADLSTLPLIP